MTILTSLLATLLAAVVWLDNNYNRGVSWGPELPRIAQADVHPLGVNLFLDREPAESNIRRTLKLTQDMGAHWVKQLFPWDQIEPTAKGDFWDERYGHSTWSHYDLIVQLCQEHNLSLIVRLDRPPEWARQEALRNPTLQAALQENPALDITGPPDHLSDYGDFVYAVVSRYRGQIHYVQIWNEPNLANEWNWDAIDPEHFVELLRIAYSRAKEADPDVQVIFPSLAPNDGRDPRHMSDLEFLKRVYEAGGGGYFDIMSAQLYGLGQPPTEHSPLGLDRTQGRLLTRTDVSRIVLLREIMEQHGDWDKAIWIGELGWNAVPNDWAGQASPWGASVDEQTKGRYITAALDRSLHEWPWAGVHNLWFLHWDGPAPKADDPTPFFALVDHDYNALPAYAAVQKWATQGIPLGVGYHRLPPQSGLDLRFVGTRLDLLLPANDDAQGLEFIVDGVRQEPHFWRYEGTESRYIVARDLPDTTHTLRLSAPAGLSWSCYVVREQPWPWLFPSLSALLAIALLISVILLLRRLPASLAALWTWAWRARARFHACPNALQNGLILGGMALSLLLFYLLRGQPSLLALPAALLLLAAQVLLALLRLDLALLAAVFFIPLYAQPVQFAGRQFAPFELIILACLAAAGLELLRSDRRRAFLARLNLSQLLPALLFMLVCAGSLLWSTDRSFVTDEGIGLLRISLREFRVTVLEPFLLYPLLLLALPRLRSAGAPVGSPEREAQLQQQHRQAGQFWWPIDALVFSAALVSLGGIVQVLNPALHAEVADGVRRASSVYGTFSPNNLALFLGRVLALAAAGGIFLARGRRKRLYLAALPLLGTAFLLTYSRSGLIALALLLLFYGLQVSRLLLWAELGLGAAGSLFLWLTGGLQRLLATDTLGNRLTMWRRAWVLVREHPWLGLGLDAFYHHYHRRYPELGAEAYWTPHNVVLEFWTRLGLLGLAGAAWLYGAFFARAGRLYRQLQDPQMRCLLLGLLGSVVYGLAHGLLDGTFFAPDWAALFWLAYGLVAALP
ncbi:MAG: O-antigen ligase family protein [Chloroflexia bacterium]|nr:O-antigen ligase family protein [Chloroflexia bacterium]